MSGRVELGGDAALYGVPELMAGDYGLFGAGFVTPVPECMKGLSPARSACHSIGYKSSPDHLPGAIYSRRTRAIFRAHSQRRHLAE
jgi:hypothetical protein